MKKFYFLLCLLFLTTALWSQNINYNFGTAAPGTATPTSNTAINVTASEVSQGNNNGTTALLTTTSASSGYVGASGSYNAGAAARTGTLTTTAGGSAYFQFTLTPDAGFNVTLQSMSFGSRSTGTGPQAFSIRSSIDNFASDKATGTLNNNSTWTLFSPVLTPISSTSGNPVTVRIYGYNGAGNPTTNTANWRIDDLNLTVAVSASGALPVHFSSLRALEKNNGIQLEWSNFTETDVSNYFIERSVDGKDFYSIATINANKNDGGRADYKYTDAATTGRTNFYRITSLEKNGKIAYTNIVKILSQASKVDLIVYPNPVSGSEVSVQIYNLQKGSYKVHLVNASGQIMNTGFFNHDGGTLSESLSVNQLNRGFYTIIINGPTQLQKQFLKQ